MYDETGPDGKRRDTVAEIAAEIGVTRPTVYRYLDRAFSSEAQTPEPRSSAPSAP